MFICQLSTGRLDFCPQFLYEDISFPNIYFALHSISTPTVQPFLWSLLLLHKDFHKQHYFYDALISAVKYTNTVFSSSIFVAFLRNLTWGSFQTE